MARTLLCIVPANMDELRQKGVEQHIFQRDLGGYWDHVVTLHPFASKNRTEELSKRHTIVEYRCRSLAGLPSLIAKTAVNARKWHPSAVKAHDPYACGVLGYIVSRICRVPYAVMICSSYDLMERTDNKPILRHRRIDRLVSRFVMSRSDMVFGGSGEAKKWAIHNGAQRDRTHTVRTGGVEERHFTPLSTRRNVKADYGWGNRKVVLYVGRLAGIKFPGDVIEAFRVVEQSIPSSVLVMAGDGPLSATLAKKAVKEIGTGRFCPLGFVPQEQLRNLMFSADVILAPLSGSALVESALSGTPIVAYNVDWHKELLEDRVSGRLVPFRAAKIMGAAATAILQDPDKGRAMGLRAREKAIEQHSLQTLYRIEAGLFERMLNDAHTTNQG